MDEDPNGPYSESAERIVVLIDAIDAQIKRIEELTRKEVEQEKLIRTLKYKIEKLEEIRRETEEKRQILENE